MGKRESAAVYRRRQIVALVIVLVPIAIAIRACTAEPALNTPTVKPQAGSIVSETATAKAKIAATVAVDDTASVKAKVSPKPRIGDCASSAISVSVTTDAESYTIGSPVTLAMRISNQGKAACKRDVGALANEVYITDIDGAVVWSSDACQSDAKPQVVVMQPGSVFGNTQTWGGLNIGRDCTSAAPDVAPGNYLAYARNDTVISKPFAFTIN